MFVLCGYLCEISKPVLGGFFGRGRGGEVFGLSVCQSNLYLGGNMKGVPWWYMLSVSIYICNDKLSFCDKNGPRKLNIGGLNVFVFFCFLTTMT
jgi:hypothetical protein